MWCTSTRLNDCASVESRRRDSSDLSVDRAGRGICDIAEMTFERMWRDLEPIGRSPRSGGYFRAPLAQAERECAAWYVEEAHRRGLDVEYDGQGNAVAWWRPSSPPAEPGRQAILVGSHLDSVDDGGAFDGDRK